MLLAASQAGSAPCGCTSATLSIPKVLHDSWKNNNQKRMHLVQYRHSGNEWTTPMLAGPHWAENKKLLAFVLLLCLRSIFCVWCMDETTPNSIGETP